MYRPRITDDTGHTEFILNQFGNAYGLLGGADNAAYAAGTDGFHRCHGRRQLGRRHQRCLLGMEAFRIRLRRAPSGTIPDIEGTQGRGMLDLRLYVLAQALEQSRLLATGNKYFIRATQVLGRNVHIVAAQLVHHNYLLGRRGRLQCLRIKALCFVTGA